MRDLLSVWEFDGEHVVEAGDGAEIERMLAGCLAPVRTADGGWRTLYRDNVTGGLWELSFLRSELQGGGPKRLRELTISDPVAGTATKVASAQRAARPRPFR